MTITTRDVIVARIRTKVWLILVGPLLCGLELIGLIFEFNPGPAQELLMWHTRGLL